MTRKNGNFPSKLQNKNVQNIYKCNRNFSHSIVSLFLKSGTEQPQNQIWELIDTSKLGKMHSTDGPRQSYGSLYSD